MSSPSYNRARLECDARAYISLAGFPVLAADGASIHGELRLGVASLMTIALPCVRCENLPRHCGRGLNSGRRRRLRTKGIIADCRAAAWGRPNEALTKRAYTCAGSRPSRCFSAITGDFIAACAQFRTKRLIAGSMARCFGRSSRRLCCTWSSCPPCFWGRRSLCFCIYGAVTSRRVIATDWNGALALRYRADAMTAACTGAT